MKSSERTWITAFLLLCMVFLSAVFAVQGSLLSTMIEAFRLDAARQGTANSLAFASGILALISAFSLQGRWKKRTLVRASVLLCSIGLVLMWIAPSYALYVAGWFITGFGLGLMDTLLSACMADLYTGKQAVTMMCILHTTYGMGSVLMPMGYAWCLSGGMFWKNVYLIIALAGAVLVAGALGVRYAARISDPEQLAKAAISPKQILPALRQGRLLWLTAGIFFHGIFISGLNTWSNRYADMLDATIALPAQSCVFLGVMLSRLLMPFLPVKPERYVCAAGFLGCAAMTVGLMLSGGWALRVMLMLSSLMFGALIPCILTLGCSRQKSNTLLATTGIMLMLYLGQGVSSPLIAALESMVNLRAGMLLCAASMALCSLCCIADAAGQKRHAQR